MEKQFIQERIQDKIKEIESYLEELSEIKPESFEQYKTNFEKRAACERYAEKIPEALADLAFLFITYKKMSAPKDDNNAFEVLAKNGVITELLSNKLQDAKGMRNIIAHEYGKIDDKIVFEAIIEQLERDAEEFIKKILEELK